ncbi:MAG: AAA family ATPase [Thermogemmata sp.]|nr:AAA family ATPase [Thermogemmata sp.]
MYILLEGLDLAGKSTVCRLLKSHVSGEWHVRRNALVANNPVCELADRLRREGEGEEMVGWLYYTALLFDLEHFCRPTENTIQDSTILLRSLAFHKVRGTPHLVERFEALVEQHPRFDYAFVLVADHQTRLERLAKRRRENLSPEDLLVKDNPQRFYAMEQVIIEYATRYLKAIKLDTSGELTPSWLKNLYRYIPELSQYCSETSH